MKRRIKNWQIVYVCLIFTLVSSSLVPAFSQPVFALEEINQNEIIIEAPNTEIIDNDLLINQNLFDSKYQDFLDVEGVGQMDALLVVEDPSYINKDIDRDEKKGTEVSVDVLSNTGALIYNFDIDTPSGRNNLEPDLKLFYDNQNQDQFNQLGMGWSTNIPFIQRVSKEGNNNLYSDHYFTSSLTGDLKLVTSTDGLHGEYVSEIDDGRFFKYELDINNYWSVTDKEGVNYKFGYSTSTRQDNPSDPTQIYKWMIEETRDTNNNYIKYEYYKDSGQIYPYKILYTGHDTIDGIFEIEFIREEKENPLESFRSSFQVLNTYRISEINIKINNYWVKKYNISYDIELSNTTSFLSMITESSRDDNGIIYSKPSNIFQYNTDVMNLLPNQDFVIPVDFVSSHNVDIGTRLADVNGDGLVDIIRARSQETRRVYINNGTGWPYDANYTFPVDFVSSSNVDIGTRLADVNGDGLVDIIRARSQEPRSVYINNGIGWSYDANYTFPVDFVSSSSADIGTRLADVNGDGLVDIIRAKSQEPRSVYINNGTGWSYDVSYTFPIDFVSSSSLDNGTRLADVNGDGLVDIIRARSQEPRLVYINNGTGWSYDTDYTFPVDFISSSNTDVGTRLADVNGDGLVEFARARSQETRSLYLNESAKKTLSYIKNSNGLQMEIIYKPSTYYRDESDELLNPDMISIFQTVKQLNVFDGAATTTIDYQYSGGEQYFDENNIRNKKFGGFAKMEKVMGDKKIITYYHQGNSSNSSQGEYQDSYYKIGKLYRKEIYDNSTDSLLEQEIYKWEEYDQGNSNKFVYNTQKANTIFATTVKSIVSQMQYSTSTGNLELESNLGEVIINIGTGDITDQLIGDEKNTDYEYAENITKHILAAPKTKIISDTVDSKQQDIYYNEQAHGLVDKVNLTKEEYENDGAEINRKFNYYGLVYEQSDSKFASTTIAYDTYNMYPASSTDSLGYTTYTDYNLLNGQVSTSTAPNEAMTVNSFDAFGRLVEVKISNPDNPIQLIVKQELSYQDTSLARYKETKNYFDINSYTTSREYYDGLDRIIQTKSQTATANEYTTVDISYDSQGRVDRQSLPYITMAIDRSVPNLTKPAKTYAYDVLDRVLIEITPVGTTGYDYDGFTTTITDANGNEKDLIKDAYGNLVEVKEYNDTSIYITSYDYTLTNKLEKITDHQGNIRNFHYDDLDNLDWQDMVHKSTVITPEKINYTHDKNGNILTETSFKNDAISYDYDTLNRVEYEKLSDVNQISYTYDQNEDIGFLTYVDYGDNNKKYYDYDILGNLKKSTTTIENESFVMDFDYNLNGDIKEITYPNNYAVIYGFNNIGQVNSVSLDKGSGSVVLADNITYNQNGQMTHLERFNGVITDYIYDPLENFRLTDLDTILATTTLQDIHYNYDAVGNITQLIDNSSTDLAKIIWYDYDDLYRLSSSTVNYISHPADNYQKTYNYDSVGNMIYNSDLGTMSYNNDNPHQVSSFTGRSFYYDGAGNTRSNSFNKFTWDWRNRVINTYNIASEKNTYYNYDHNNQRFLKYTEELVFIPPNFEDSFVDMGMMMAPMAAGGVGTWELHRVKEDKYVDGYFEKNLTDKTKTHINLGNAKLATINENDNPYFILGDHLGSSSILTDSIGSVVELSDYLPFGKINYESISENLDNDYNFTGKEIDEETSIQYFGARYMDNEIGKFISVDPLLLKLDKNSIYDKLYANQYSSNDNFNNLLVTLKAEKGNLTNNNAKEVSFYYFLSNPQQLNNYSYVTNNPVVSVDNNGEWEVHFQFSNNVGFGGEYGTSYKFGVASDGSYGTSQAYHYGGLAGGDASLSLGVGVSNLKSWDTSEKESLYTKLGGKIVGVGLQAAQAFDEDGMSGFDFEISAGPSTPLYLGAGIEEDYTTMYGNIKDDIGDFINYFKNKLKYRFRR